jgi:hypothetical protein
MVRQRKYMNAMRALYCSVRTALIILAAVLGFLPAASADEVWGFVRVTCAPELGFFSIQRFAMTNLPHGGPYLTRDGDQRPDVVTSLENTQGIYDSGGLKARPFSCAIPALPPTIDAPATNRVGFRVRVVGHLDTSSPIGSYATIIDDAEVIVSDKRLAIMGLNPYGLARGADLIEIKRDGQEILVRTCTVDGGAADKLTCEDHPLN